MEKRPSQVRSITRREYVKFLSFTALATAGSSSVITGAGSMVLEKSGISNSDHRASSPLDIKDADMGLVATGMAEYVVGKVGMEEHGGEKLLVRTGRRGLLAAGGGFILGGVAAGFVKKSE